jgi:NAD(P) transhydrogenase subunit alpha
VTDIFTLLTVFILAIFVGFEVISKVPTTLHTPLMSATNAIHGVVIVGAIIVVAGIFGAQLNGPVLTAVGIAAVTLGTINVVGGFAVTERMLQMFRKRETVKK